MRAAPETHPAPPERHHGPPHHAGRIIQAAGEPRLRALVAVLWESGLRAGEVVALNTGSVSFDEYGAVLQLPRKATGLKTGARKVRLIPNESVPYLQEWFEIHPFKNEPDKPLFHGSSRRAPYVRLNGSALYSFIQTITKRAELKRHIKPHDFRHTAATEKARLGFNEASLRHYFGWTRSSDMSSHYVHLAGADFEDMMFEKYGIKKDDERPPARHVRPVPTMHAHQRHHEPVLRQLPQPAQARSRKRHRGAPKREPHDLGRGTRGGTAQGGDA